MFSTNVSDSVQYLHNEVSVDQLTYLLNYYYPKRDRENAEFKLALEPCEICIQKPLRTANRPKGPVVEMQKEVSGLSRIFLESKLKQYTEGQYK